MKSNLTIFILCAAWSTFLSHTGVLGSLEGESVIGGRATRPLEFPYVVSLRNASFEHHCGGGIIAEQYILTAAHCVFWPNASFQEIPLKIVAGVNDVHDTDAVTRVVADVEKIYVAEHYDHTLWRYKEFPTGDIAVLKLKNKLDINGNPGLAILDLPEKIPGTEKYYSYLNETAILAGFGYDFITFAKSFGGYWRYFGNSTGELHKANVLIHDKTDCHLYMTSILDSQICASVNEHNDSTPQGVCHTDSGSPLVIENTVVGVVSAGGLACNNNIVPSIYTRVTSHLEFIRNAMKDITYGMRVATVA